MDTSELAQLPVEVGAWHSTDVPVPAAVESMLRADFNLQRMYVHALGEVVWLYVGYYGTTRGGRPEHTPRTCYQANGWGVKSRRRLEIDPQTGFRVNEYVVERDRVRRLAHFWYRSHRATGILGDLGLSLDHMLGRLAGGRADGALVRISTPIEDHDVVTARSRLAGFGTALERLLDQRWPSETPIREDE
jgi:EpsI family protein